MTDFLNPAYIIAILIAISVHEWAHAYTAHRLGDPTPGYEGRLTLNPLAHLDLMGALMFVIVGFGWAKPVPVDSSYFRHPKQGMVLTALAGPLSNLVLATIAFALLVVLAGVDGLSLGSLFGGGMPSSPLGFAVQVLRSSLFVNLALMAFNLFPIAPLDDANIARAFIPRGHDWRYEEFFRMGPYILLFLILFERYLPFQPLSLWVHTVVSSVLRMFALLL